MSLFAGHNVICLDCEVLHSPDDLPTGWSDYAALGLSIGGYWDGMDGCVHWFDQANLLDTMLSLVVRQPLIISFNGIKFDGPLMLACVPEDVLAVLPRGDAGRPFEAEWKALWAHSYDMLAEVWRITGRDYARGNSLDALCAANGLGKKTGHGAQAPLLWQRGHIAEVLNYCQNDVMLTLALATRLTEREGRLERQAGALRIRYLKPWRNFADEGGAYHLDLVDPETP